MIKKEGHSHTEFCPHGSGDDVEAMIQKAIKLGFDSYSITEHAPLPPEFKTEYAGNPTGFTEASMAASDLPAYFKKCERLRDQYRDQIQINIGFELDYLPHHTDWTRAFLSEYGPRTTDNILSIHFMQGTHQHFWCVDDTLADFKAGLLDNLPDGQRLYRQYFNALIAAVSVDLGPYAPHRIGHITLIRKFQDYFKLPDHYDQQTQIVLDHLLVLLRQKGYALDYNAAGLYKEYCNDAYPDLATVRQAQQLGIPLVYGSDAHSVKEVGHGYHALMANLD